MNPISHARLLAGVSTTKIARELKVSKQYISRLEQGIYETPNKVVASWAASILRKNSSHSIGPETVEALYNKWQWDRRENTKANRGLRPVTVSHYDKVSQRAQNGSDVIYYHKIFGQWVSSYWDSAHSFCVAMCLHPSPVADYIDGATHSMPKKLAEVLSQLDLIGEGFKTNER